jgi:hydrogenase-4 component B
MLIPMGFFALMCLLVGLLPQFALRLVLPAMGSILHDVSSAAVIPVEYATVLGRLSLLAILLIAITVAVALFWHRRLRSGAAVPAATWGCGYQRATARMQYVASSFSGIVVSVLDGIIRQRIERPVLTGLFPQQSHCVDFPSETALEQFIGPSFTLAGGGFAFLRRLQHGHMHVYMLYIFATLFILMIWAH